MRKPGKSQLPSEKRLSVLKLEVPVTGPMIDALGMLRDQGLYGQTISDVALRLVEDGIRRIIREAEEKRIRMAGGTK